MPTPTAPHVVVLDASPVYAAIYDKLFRAEGIGYRR